MIYRGFNDDPTKKMYLPPELFQKIADMSDLCTALKLSSVRHSIINMHDRIQSVLQLENPPFDIPRREICKLTTLRLKNKNLNPTHMTTFSRAIANGALGALRQLALDSNQIGDAGIIAFANAIKPTPQNPMGALGSLVKLDLYRNRIGDVGMQSFASAVASGALPLLEQLFLFNNAIGDAGLAAFADAIAANGALPALKEVWVDDKHMRHPQLVAACQPRGIAIM